MASKGSIMPFRFCRLVFLSTLIRLHAPDSDNIVQDEFEMNLRLLGAQTIKDVVPDMVDASNVHTHLVAVPRDQLYEANCTLLCDSTRQISDSFSR